MSPNSYDFFISYTWRDPDQIGRQYAAALKERLTESGFVCFLDSSDYEKGDDWKQIGQLALFRTGELLLIVTPRVFDSYPVLREVKLFHRTKRRLRPIDINGTLARAEQDHYGHELLRLIPPRKTIAMREDTAAPHLGPSKRVVDEIKHSFKLARQKNIRRRVVALVIVLLALLGLATELQRRQAVDNATIASAERERAEYQRARAEENEDRAASGEARAREELLRANENLARVHQEKALSHLDRAEASKSIGEYQRAWLHTLQAQRQAIQGQDALPIDTLARLMDQDPAAVFAMQWRSPAQWLGEVVRALAWSPDGTRLATASDDNSIRLWSAESGEEQLRLTGHSGWVLSVAFNGDGTRLASSSFDMTVRLWDTLSGEELEGLTMNAGEVNSVAFAGQSALLASGTTYSGVVLRNLDRNSQTSPLNLHSERRTAYSAKINGVRHDFRK